LGKLIKSAGFSIFHGFHAPVGIPAKFSNAAEWKKLFAFFGKYARIAKL